MSKKWQIVDKQIDPSLLQNNPEINKIILRLLLGRDFNISQIQNWLQPSYEEGLHSPFLFKDMQAVVDLINSHLANNHKIIIYGDYDADGVTSTALLFKTLDFLATEKNISSYIPDRITEGYGLNKTAIKKIADDGVKLLITVDNGIRSIEEVAYAKSLGLEIIITDHHESGDELPDCLIINPKVENETYPFTGLAGVGVAFKVAQALLSDEVFIKWLLDFVALGTIADLMPLIDENRVLVKYGLIVINKTQRLGLQELINIAQSNKDNKGNARVIDTWQVGFQLAPRLNAAGRLGSANSAYQLLISEDKNDAVRIAEELNKTNIIRQTMTKEIFASVDESVDIDGQFLLTAVYPGLTNVIPSEASLSGAKSKESRGDGNVAVETGSLPAGQAGLDKLEMTKMRPWSPGIMGLVAGKLTEKYYRPSLAITDKNEEIVGSGRSIAEFDITEMLEECSEYLSAFGGHKQACGFTLKNKESLQPFLDKANAVAEDQLKNIELVPTIEVDLELNFSDISEELYDILQKLKPFGMGNTQPKFVSKFLKVVNANTMGADGQHLRLKLQQNSIMFDAIAFGVDDEWKNIKIGDTIDMVYHVDINEWNGNKSVQLKIIDVRI